jgi:hypothetical protein
MPLRPIVDELAARPDNSVVFLDKLTSVERSLQAGLDKLQKAVDPLAPLPQYCLDLDREKLPLKADLSRLEDMERELQREIGKLDGGSQLSPEMLAALNEIAGLKRMQATVSEHAKTLASLFTSKAGKDELGRTEARLGEVASSFELELGARAAELSAAMAAAKQEQARELSQLGQVVAVKADTEWLTQLEAELRAEFDRLRADAKGKSGGISKAEFEKRLAELRKLMAALQAAGGGAENGAVAFRCLACDRPLPKTESWSPPSQVTIARRYMSVE